jgi:signal transduction histidine kinase
MDRPFRPIDMPQVTAILMSIAGQLNFRAVIRAASQEISGHLPHDHVDIALMSPDGQMVTAWETGLHTEWDAETTATKAVDVSPIRDLFRGRVDHIITGDAQNDPRFHFEGAFSTPIFAVGLRSRLHVPLKVEGRVFGALSFSTQQVNSYRAEDIGNARIVADILSGYIYALRQGELARQSAVQQAETEARAEGLRLGARQLAEALEDARRTIGMDLHDQTVADLSRISRNIRRLADRGGALGSELATLEEDINHCLRELRVIVDDARPSVLELFGFADAVEALMERSASQLLTPVVWHVADSSSGAIDRMPAHTQIALYRIVQEAVNNAFRHSGAAEIAVRIAASGPRAMIRVQDTGTGLSTDLRRHASGIANMRTRAALIDAGFKLKSGPQGTEIRLEIDSATHPPPRESETR